MRIVSILALIVTISFIIGCGHARPKEMPETAPCRVTVLDNGKPMPGVSVTLHYPAGSASLSIGGMTNSSGVAEIKTTWGNYTAKGAPLGVHKVVVDKHVEVPPETVTPEESALWTPAQAEKYFQEREAMIDNLRVIPKALSMTPLSLTVEAHTGGSLTVDVGDYRK